MNTKEVKEFFANLPDKEKAAFLSSLAFEFTILARETYQVGAEGLDDPALMRAVNEIQHRILGYASQLLGSENSRDHSLKFEPVLWQMIFDANNKELKKMSESAVSHVLTKFAPVLV